MSCCYRFLFSLLLTIFVAKASVEEGTATFYAPPYIPSACNGYHNDGVMIAGVSEALWDNRAACGNRYKVRCKGPYNQHPKPCHVGQQVVVKIVDHCANCNGTINLSRDAFDKIASLQAGKIYVYYERLI